MKKYYILAVDDEPINLLILEELFEEYELVCVSSAIECLDLLACRRADLILMDVNMPHMSGLEACQQIRQRPNCVDIPIIMLSALASEADIALGLKSGADGYITKPFDDTFMDIIHGYLIESSI